MDKNLKYICLIFFCLNYICIYSQQTPSLSNHTDFYNLYNPAALDNFFMIGRVKGKQNYVDLFYNHQWITNNLKGEPRTFGVDVRLRANEKWITRIGFISDKTGAISVNQLNIRANRRLIKNQTVDLFIGGGIYVGAYNVNFGMVDIDDVNDPVISEGGFSNQYFMRTSLGVFSRIKINSVYKVFAGISMLQIESFQSKLSLTKAKHFNSKIGVLSKLSNNRGQDRNQMYLEISTTLQYVVNAPFYIDGNARILFDFNESSNNLLSIGIGYSSNKRLKFESVCMFEKFGFGIIWDVVSLSNKPINHFGNFNTFEIRGIIPF